MLQVSLLNNPEFVYKGTKQLDREKREKEWMCKIKVAKSLLERFEANAGQETDGRVQRRLGRMSH